MSDTSATEAVSDSVEGPPVTKPVAVVLVMSTALAAGAIMLLATGPPVTDPALPSSWWWVAIIVAGFALADRFAFHVEFRRQAITFTLSEVPTVFALVYLGPAMAVATRVATGLAMIYVRTRPPLYKSFFNLAMFAFEMALAFAVFTAWIDATDSSELMIVMGSVAGVVASSAAGSLLVLLAIACFEGALLARLRAELPVAAAVAMMGALVGATALAPTFIRSSFVLLSAIPIVAVWLTISRHARLAQSHRDLSAVHEFAATISRSLDIDELADGALDQLREQFRSEHARIVLGAPDSPHTRTWSTEPLAQAEPEPDIGDTASDGTTDTAGEPAGNTLTATLRHGSEAMGHVSVHGRNGVTNVFDAEDAQRLDAFATQLAGALTNALAHARMEHDASHDVLTGDLNRAAFDRQVKERLQTRPRFAATLMIDLDNFKEVNDTLGHHVGDEVLREFSRRINALLDDDDVFARFGGDEFAAYIERDDDQAIRSVADAILSASYSAVCLDGLDVVVTSSVGIATVADDDTDAGSLLRRADIAMYSAKGQRAGFEIYTEDIDRRTPERLSLLGDLRRALDDASLEVHFQPKIALDSGTVTGAEALVRWNHPSRGWVGPDEFIPLAEESGLVRLLTDQVVAASIAQASSWRQAGHDLGVAVNLSTLDLLDELLVNRIDRHLEAHGLAAEHLTLEITESSLMVETPRVLSTINELDQLGVALALDDFGTGFSSLSYLRQLPVTELKIDRSFVGNLLLDEQDEVIVKSTIDLGRNLGLTVVAEGIESDRVSERLRMLGCHLGQGFGISRPLPAELFLRWLTSWGVPDESDEMAPVVELKALRN